MFGATVVVSNEDEKKLTFMIVGVDEARPREGKVSWVSPIAKSLLNSSVGDVVTVSTPRGAIDYEIINIKYEEIH